MTRLTLHRNDSTEWNNVKTLNPADSGKINASNANGLDRKCRMAKAQYNPTLMHMKYDMTVARSDQPESSSTNQIN